MTFASRMKRRKAQRRVSRGLTAEQLAQHELTASRTLTVADGSRIEDGDKVSLDMFTVETIIKHIKAGRIWIEPVPGKKSRKIAKPSPEEAAKHVAAKVVEPDQSVSNLSADAQDLLTQLDSSCTAREIKNVFTRANVGFPATATKSQLMVILENARAK